MNPAEMFKAALDAKTAGTRLSLVRMRGTKPPPKFPRGELLCVNPGGWNVYSYDPAKIIKWIEANCVVQVVRVAEEAE